MASSSDLQRFLLTQIVAPSVTSSDYAARLSDSFKNIDDNFKKLLAVPFLQGADAKEFKLEKINLFSTESDSPTLTSKLSDWGKSIVYSILESSSESFNEDLAVQTTLREVNDAVRRHISDVPAYKSVEGIYATNSLLKSPYIYAYVTRDDSGKVTNQFVAQSVRFIDARIEYIKTDSTNIGFEFEELSCFLVHNPNENGGIGTWSRIYLTPTIYYNKEDGVWQWKIDGNKTGISAQGIKGDDGTPGPKYWIVSTGNPLNLVQSPEALENNTSVLDVQYVFTTPDNSSSLSDWGWYSLNDSSIREQVKTMKTGDLVFSLAFDSFAGGVPANTPVDMFLTTLSAWKENETVHAGVLYRKQLSFKEYLESIRFKDMLDNVGCSSTESLRGLYVKSNPDQTTSANTYNPVNMFYAMVSAGGQEKFGDLHIGLSAKPEWTAMYSDNQDLSNDGDNETGMGISAGRMVIDNYCLHASEILLTSKDKLSVFDEDDEENGLDDLDISEINKLRKGLLNVYGQSYFVGGINIDPNGEGFVIKGNQNDMVDISSGEVNISSEVTGQSQNSGRGLSKRTTNPAKILLSNSGLELCASDYIKTAGKKSGKKIADVTISKNGEDVLYTSSWGSDGQCDQDASLPSVEIPLLSSRKMKIQRIDASKIKIGNSCIVDGAARTVGDINNDFQLLNTGGSSESTVSKTIAMDVNTSITKSFKFETGGLFLRPGADSDKKIVSQNSIIDDSYYGSSSGKSQHGVAYDNVICSKTKDLYFGVKNISTDFLPAAGNRSKIIDALKNNIVGSYPDINKSTIISMSGNIYVLLSSATVNATMSLTVDPNCGGLRPCTVVSPVSKTDGDLWNKPVIYEKSGVSKFTCTHGINKTVSFSNSKILVGTFNVDSNNNLQYKPNDAWNWSDLSCNINLGDDARFGIIGKYANLYEDPIFTNINFTYGDITYEVKIFFNPTQVTYKSYQENFKYVIGPNGIIAKISGQSGYFSPVMLKIATGNEDLNTFVSTPQNSLIFDTSSDKGITKYLNNLIDDRIRKYAGKK